VPGPFFTKGLSKISERPFVVLIRYLKGGYQVG